MIPGEQMEFASWNQWEELNLEGPGPGLFCACFRLTFTVVEPFLPSRPCPYKPPYGKSLAPAFSAFLWRVPLRTHLYYKKRM